MYWFLMMCFLRFFSYVLLIVIERERVYDVTINKIYGLRLTYFSILAIRVIMKIRGKQHKLKQLLQHTSQQPNQPQPNLT